MEYPTPQHHPPTTTTTNNNNPLKKTLLILNCLLLILGSVGGPLLLRLYFNRGGSRKWLSSWLETAGWPFLLLPLLFSYLHRSRHHHPTQAFLITPSLFLASAALGLLTGFDDFLYAYGLSYLPVSTSALLTSTHLVFTAAFAFIIVRQRFTAYSLNAVALLSVGAVVLALHTSGDRPEGESKKEYFVGFFLILAAAALYGFVLPMIELTYRKTKTVVTYALVMEMQMVMSFFATAFCTVGMVVNKDFQVMTKEAKEYELGETKYYVVLVFCAIFWQLFFVGAVGAISCYSSLLAGIIIAVMIPVTESLAVLFFHENFSGEKGISLALSIWGFASYFYGEYKMEKKKRKMTMIVMQDQC
ncbi:Purine permease 3 [Acorus calamus]|uniref:Probable purine permease n=1 Tax=Acorus calamus TaxID=4465 RepID=A0AAV9DQ65_ACOCL|nr:Purine permease 3 [Acorus calamus]